MAADTSPAGPPARPPGEFRRLHPLTPVLRGWKVFAAVVAIALQQAYGGVPPFWVFTVIAASVPVGVAYGFLSWRRTHYRISQDDLRLETGVLFRRSRQVRLDRLQAVDVVRPLVARALGLAELRLEVAGGSSSEAPLAYLSEPAAQQLRAELLARAAGLEHDQPQAPVAPERVLLTVPLGRLVESQLRSAVTFWTLVVGASLVAMSAVSGEPAALGLAVPFLLVAVPAAINGVAGQFDFTVADSPDGLRLRRGLLETRAQTVPPGRIQAVRVVEPLLWRSRGWVRVEANVAGYVGEGQQKASLLAPVATGDEAARLVALALPGLDLPAIAMSGVPRQARFLDPWQWRSLSVGADEHFLVVRRGRWRRETDLVPHEKVQSVRISQALLQRRLGLATLHVDTTPGPVKVTAAHRDQRGARELLDAEVTRARESRAAARPDRWMQPPTRPDGPTVAL